MKNFKQMLALFLVGLSTTFASAQIQIKTSQISYEDKLRPVLQATTDADAKTISTAWVKFLKDAFDIKVKGNGLFKSDILDATDVFISEISDKRMNLYSRVTETATGSEIKVFGSLGYDFYLGNEGFEKEFSSLQNILNRFLQGAMNTYYVNEIDFLTKEISRNEKEIGKLEKSIGKNTDSIGDLARDIETYEVVNNGGNSSDAKAVSKHNKNLLELTKQKTAVDEEKQSIKLLKDENARMVTKLDKVQESHHRLLETKTP